MLVSSPNAFHTLTTRPASCFLEPALTASCPACGQMSRTGSKLRLPPGRGPPPVGTALSGFSCARGGSPVTRCSAAGRDSPSGSAMCYLPTPDEPDVSSISSAIWPSRLEDARRRVLLQLLMLPVSNDTLLKKSPAVVATAGLLDASPGRGGQAACTLRAVRAHSGSQSPWVASRSSTSDQIWSRSSSAAVCGSIIAA